MSGADLTGMRLECTNRRHGGGHRQDPWRVGGGRPLLTAGMSGDKMMTMVAKVEAVNGQVAR